MSNTFILEVIPYKKHWAIQATWKGEVRYRQYYYKADAIKALPTWRDNYNDINFNREFYHNFYDENGNEGRPNA